MARCVDCDREGCQKVEAWTSFVACNCAISMANPCEHQKAAHIANADCAAHAVNWRERALKAEARQAWVPVGERLPDNGEMVAVWLGGIDTGFLNDGVWYVRPSAGPHGGGGYNPTRKITHWRPMPAPPEGE